MRAKCSELFQNSCIRVPLTDLRSSHYQMCVHYDKQTTCGFKWADVHFDFIQNIVSLENRKTARFTCLISHQPSTSYLWEHRVARRALFPGAAMFELAYAAGASLLSAHFAHLTWLDSPFTLRSHVHTDCNICMKDCWRRIKLIALHGKDPKVMTLVSQGKFIIWLNRPWNLRRNTTCFTTDDFSAEPIRNFISGGLQVRSIDLCLQWRMPRFWHRWCCRRFAAPQPLQLWKLLSRIIPPYFSDSLVFHGVLSLYAPFYGH